MSDAHAEETVLHVGGASPYDVVVGHHLADHLPVMVGDALRVAIDDDKRHREPGDG